MNQFYDSVKDFLKKNKSRTAVTCRSVAISDCDVAMLRTLGKLRSELTGTHFNLPEAIAYLNRCRYLTTLHHNHIGPGDIYSNPKPLVTCHVLSVNKGPLDTDLPPILLLERVVRRIVATISLFSIKKRFVFWLVPCKKNRTFPSRGVVTPKNINGGFTYVNDNDIENEGDVVNIYIYRSEEFPKVMLHETLHHSRIDSHTAWSIAEIDTLKKQYNIHHSTVFLPNEAIVEAWAVIMHTIFVATEFSLPFNVLWQREWEWAELQSARLVAYQYEGKPNTYQWREETNSYCYIVLKAHILRHATEFVATEQSAVAIKTFVMNKMMSISQLSYQKDFRVFNKNSKNKATTMRMTVFGNL